MYTITTTENKFTIPEGDLRFLAIQKAMNLNIRVKLDTNDDAINFLNKLGIKVE